MSDASEAQERSAWIALACTPGIGQVTFERLIATFGSAVTALAEVSRWSHRGADPRLARTIGVPLHPGVAATIRAAAADPGAPEQAMRRLGGWTLTPLDAEYPPLLHQLTGPPAVLFGLGTMRELRADRPVAVVGTRHPTASGRDLATRFSTRLVEGGATVVSGLAMGIDGAAHQAALEAGGRTIAVVAGGLDEPGPAVHRRLAGAIAAGGAVVSEHAPGIRPTQGTFPRRNRVISGLSLATIVIEAPARSGALITASHALEQGRLLLVAPGRPLDPRVAGNLALLRETPARPLVGLDEMIVDLDFDSGAEDTSGPGRLSSTAALELLGPTERAVATSLLRGPSDVDGLVRETGLAPGIVAAALTILQLRGWARPYGALHLPAGALLQKRR